MAWFTTCIARHLGGGLSWPYLSRKEETMYSDRVLQCKRVCTVMQSLLLCLTFLTPENIDNLSCRFFFTLATSIAIQSTVGESCSFITHCVFIYIHISIIINTAKYLTPYSRFVFLVSYNKTSSNKWVHIISAYWFFFMSVDVNDFMTLRDEEYQV